MLNWHFLLPLWMEAKVVDQDPLGLCVTYLSIYIYIYIWGYIVFTPIKTCSQHPNQNNCANLQLHHPNKIKFNVHVTNTSQTQKLSCAWLGELRVRLGWQIKECGCNKRVVHIAKQMDRGNTRKAEWKGVGCVVEYYNGKKTTYGKDYMVPKDAY